MSKMVINLEKYIDDDNHSLVGRENGKKLSEKIGFDEVEDFHDVVEFIIPSSVITMNGSFFAGFFKERIKKLGKDKFMKKYRFKASSHIKDRIDRYATDVLLEI